MSSEFSKWMVNRHEAVKEWKEKNQKPVVGYFCCVVPEELVYSAGALPVKISGSTEKTEVVDEHMVPYGCAFVQSCFDLAARGVYDYMDTVIVPNTCDLVARMEYWYRVASPRASTILGGLEAHPYVFYLNYPEKLTGSGVHPFLLNQFRLLKQHVERLTNSYITDEMLRETLEMYNEHYRLMAQLDELRKQDPPALSGYEAFEAEWASLLMPKPDHNEMMKKFLKDISERGEKPKKGVRLFLSGGSIDQNAARIYQIIEESGGQVVGEDISTGTSYFRGITFDTSKAPMDASVELSLKVPCPRSTVDANLLSPYPEYRWNYVKNVVKDRNIQGAIIYNLGYCECRGLEIPHFRERFREELNVPTLVLSGDYTMEVLEENRSKIEAFIEMIGD